MDAVYPSDLTDEQWQAISRLIPSAKPGGRPRTVDMREVLNALFYLARTGCAWRMLPKDYPPKDTVYYYFKSFRQDGTWERIHDLIRRRVRVKHGKRRQPSAAILDSQSVKTTEKRGDCCGYDAGKKVKGRKRHLVVDTLGLIWGLVVHGADVQDRDGAKLVLETVNGKLPRLELIWADGGYAGKLIDWVKQVCGWAVEIVKRSDDAEGFEVLPKRWIVERTFGWFGWYRRLSKDYEELTDNSQAMILVCMIHRMVRHLKPADLAYGWEN